MILHGPTNRIGLRRRPPGPRDRIASCHVLLSGVHFRFRPGLELMEDRTLLSTILANVSGTLGNSVPLAIGVPVSRILSPGGTDFYQIQPSSDGRLIAQTSDISEGLELRLSIDDGQGNVLVASDGLSASDPDNVIDEHVPAGTDILEVEDLSGSGSYSLATSFTPASDPNQTLTLPPNFQGTGFAPIAVGNFTGNGVLDIVAPDGVHLGTGDGTFQAPSPEAALANPAQEPTAIAVGDFNDDRNLDVAVALGSIDCVSISLGNGDGTFQPASLIGMPVAGTPDAIVAGDFGNGQTDLAVAIAGTGRASDDVVVLMGNGDGGFTKSSAIPVGVGPDSIAAGAFGPDGHFLAVADSSSGDVTILTNQGGGSFSVAQTIELPGSYPSSIVAGNFGTGNLDLAVTDSSNSVVDIFDGKGDGTFQPQPVATLPVGANPSSIITGDFGDGDLDLAVADASENDVSVLLGNGNGTFQPAIDSPTTSSGMINAQGFAAGSFPVDIVAGDFNGDGRLDLATGNAGSSDISVLLGKGDGTFEAPRESVVGDDATALATGDFTGNRNLGVAVLNQGSDSVTILPGNGDGTFQEPLTVSLPQGSGATSIVAADFNDDGRTDLAITDAGLNEVSILMGNGDGTFQTSTIALPTGSGPYAIAAGEFTGDGQIDLAVADQSSSSVTILLGNGDGTFTVGQTIALVNPADLTNPYSFPDAIVAGNFASNGQLDLAVAEPFIDAVTVLLGNGNGTFTQGSTIAFGDGFPFVPDFISLAAGDFRNNGLTDLAVVSSNPFVGDTVDVLLSNDDGTFQTPDPISLGFGAYPVAVVVGDFTNNGILDLATADSNGAGTDDYSVCLGNGDGTFQFPTAYALGGSGGSSSAIATGDFTGNGRFDLVIARTNPDSVQMVLNNGDGTFSSTSALDLDSPATPLVADVSGDGSDDVLVVDGFGNILDRRGITEEPNTFELPTVINPGFPSRAIAWVPNTSVGPLLASVDADDDAVSLYAYQNGDFVRIGSLTTGRLPEQIVAADLSGDGWDDLVVRNAGDSSLTVYFNSDDKTATGLAFSGPKDLVNQLFGFPITLFAGIGVSDVEAIDTSGDGRLDLVVTSQATGQVSVLFNQGNGSFAAPVSYRAGTSLSEIDPGGTPEVISLEATAGVAGGPLTSGGLTDLVTIDPGSNTLDVLEGLGGGRFANPVAIPTQEPALVVGMGVFAGNGIDDLAVLTANGLYIYLGNGKGGFLPPSEFNVGFEPSGLTVADVNHDGRLDLLVGDSRGDVQVLLGQGNGTFQAPFPASEPPVELAADVAGSGVKYIVSTDQRTDEVIVDHDDGGVTVLGFAATGVVDPGAPTLADLNGDGIPDLIVPNSGSNNVLIYPGLGNGQFGPAINDGGGYFAGINPVGVTVADLTGNLPDLVVADDEGDQITILINTSTSTGGISFQPGPVLNLSGGPVSTVVGDFTGNGIPDLLVTLSQSNGVVLLPGLGNGLFNDQNPVVFGAGNVLGQAPVVFPVGNSPVTSFVGRFDGQNDLVTVDSGSNTLTFISGFGGPNPVASTIASGGLQPDAAFAFSSGSGFENLVVGNAGDGTLALFEGGPGGLSLTSAESDPNLPTPTALAYSALTGGQIQFYAATAGSAEPELVSLNLAGDASVQVGLPGPSNTVAQLVSFGGSSLPLVATVLTLTIEVPGSELNLQLEGAENGGSGAFLPGSGVTVGQSLSSTGRLTSSGDPVLPVELIPLAPGAAHGPASPWERFVLGLDQVLERILRENPNGLSGVVNRPESPAMQGSSPPGGLMAPPSATAPPAQSGEHDGDHGPSAGGTSKAVDSVIEMLWRAGGSRGHSGRSSAGWGPVLEPRNGGMREIRVVRSLQSASPTHDSRADTAGFGSRRRAIMVPRGAGKDERGLGATLAFVVLAHEWARSRLVSRVSGARIPFTSTRGSKPLAIDRRPVGAGNE